MKQGHDDTTNGHSESTQLMMSTLGRFHREVSRARLGAASPGWSDTCMQELVSAAEIAVEQGWREVLPVLTETGRILHSYEIAGRASECLVFLSAAYDVLSLMIGDLIAGAVRTGVIEKWHLCHTKALEELEAAGLTLVKDDEEEAEASPPEEPHEKIQEAPPETKTALNTVPFELPPLEDFAEEYEEGADPLPRLAEFASRPADDPDTIIIEGTIPADKLDVEPETPSAAATSADMEIPAETAEREEETIESSAENAESESGRSRIETVLDSFSEDLNTVSENKGADLTSVFEGMKESAANLKKEAEANKHNRGAQVCTAMEQLCGLLIDGFGTPDESFLVLGYSFCETFMETRESPFAQQVNDWIQECDSLYLDWKETKSTDLDEEVSAAAETEPVEAAEIALENLKKDEKLSQEVQEETVPSKSSSAGPKTVAGQTPEPAAMPAPADSSPEALLQIAQQAIARGSAAQAKVLAMKAAIGFAEREAGQAEQNLSAIENRVKEGAEQLSGTKAELSETEAAVKKAEEHTEKGKKQLRLKEENTQTAQARIESIHSEIDDIRNQIVELQNKLADANLRTNEADEDLKTKISEQDEAKDELASRAVAEEQTRDTQEQVRQKIKNIEHVRAGLEMEMERARDILMQQRNSIDDIAKTIKMLNPSGDDSPDGDAEMLF